LLLAQNSHRCTQPLCQMCFLARSHAISVFGKQSMIAHSLVNRTYLLFAFDPFVDGNDRRSRAFFLGQDGLFDEYNGCHGG
jgi:hypothetical protein